MHRRLMSSPHERPTSPRDHHPAAAGLLPVLVWLNRRELASRFPAWQPRPHAGTGEHEASQGEPEHGRSR
jgi:hypothetical protein